MHLSTHQESQPMFISMGMATEGNQNGSPTRTWFPYLPKAQTLGGVPDAIAEIESPESSFLPLLSNVLVILSTPPHSLTACLQSFRKWC